MEDLDLLMDGIAELNVQLGGVRGSRRGLERAAGLVELMRDQLATRRASAVSEAELVKLRALVDELQALLFAAERDVSTGGRPGSARARSGARGRAASAARSRGITVELFGTHGAGCGAQPGQERALRSPGGATFV